MEIVKNRGKGYKVCKEEFKVVKVVEEGKWKIGKKDL